MSGKDEEEIFIVKSLRYMQENLCKSGSAAVAGYILLAALLIFGGIGYALDIWLGTSPWLLIAGLLLGLVVGFVELAKVIFWDK